MQYPAFDAELSLELTDLATVLLRRRRPLGYRSFLKVGGRLAEAAREARERQRRRSAWPKTWPRRLLRIGRWILQGLAYVHVVFIAVVLLVTLLWKFVNPAATAFMAYRSLVSGYQNFQPLYIPLREIPASTVRAFVYLEDHDFYVHHGISPQAIREAAERNARLKQTVFGGSTITQQLARNLFLNPERTWLRKYLEAYVTLILEGVLGKDRIMELYLNYIEFGRGAFGLGRGAYYQYGRPFYSLTWEERSRLAVIITNPIKYTVDTLFLQPGMAQRYAALMGVFGPSPTVPAPSPAPSNEPVAGVSSPPPTAPGEEDEENARD